MSRKLAPAKGMESICLVYAIDHLRRARHAMAGADCPKAMAAIRRALRSAEGAERHMRRRVDASKAVSS